MWIALSITLAALLAYGYARYRREMAAVREQIKSLEQERDALADRHQNAEARAEALFNGMLDGVVLVDADGIIRLANQTIYNLFKPQGDLRGRTLLAAFQRHELTEIVEKAARSRQEIELDFGLVDAERRAIQVVANVVRNNENETLGTLLVFNDLTRLKQLEKTRQEFVANVSHELRTPLSLIQGYVETLLDGAKDDPANTTRFLQTIAKHADRLTFLIEDLLTISALESGRVSMNFQRTTLRSVGEKVLEDLTAKAADKQVQLKNEITEGVQVRGDGDRLQQVFFNLVENAIKYGRTAGQVVIGCRPGKTGMVEAWVRDDGPGIPKEASERIFERFFRVDKARSRETGGTGLGLAIVKHIVQTHGGEVWVESEVGHGTTFFFSVPLPDQAEARPAAEIKPAA